MKKLTRHDLLFKSIDIHTHSTGVILEHIISGNYPVVQDVVDLSDSLHNNHIDYAVTFPMPFSVYYSSSAFWHENQLLASGLCSIPYEPENKSLLSLIDRFKIDNLLPFLSFSLHEKVSEQLTLLKELISNFPVYGLKYHTTTDCSSVTNPTFALFAELALQYDLPIMIHTKMTETANPMNILDLAASYPTLRICAAHCAKCYYPFFEELEKRRLNNVFIDCSPFLKICAIQKQNQGKEFIQVQYDCPNLALKSLVAYCPERWLWGTDAPWHRYERSTNELFSYADEVRVLQQSSLRELFSKNSIRFLFSS